jgi:cytochrome c oxidase subunit 1
MQLLFLFNFFYSLKFGKLAGENPYEATTLEWSIPSPPPFDNFAGHVPVVYRGAYEFGVPGYDADYIPQTLVPEKVGSAQLGRGH